MTPPLDENFWLLRIRLSPKQAVVAFSKFGTFGIGFQHEVKEWNCNCVFSLPAERIYDGIKCNKGDRRIPDAVCIRAIKKLQSALKRVEAKTKRPTWATRCDEHEDLADDTVCRMFSQKRSALKSWPQCTRKETGRRKLSWRESFVSAESLDGGATTGCLADLISYSLVRSLPFSWTAASGTAVGSICGCQPTTAPIGFARLRATKPATERRACASRFRMARSADLGARIALCQARR